MQHVSGRDRYIEEYLAHMATGGNQVVARPNRRRMLVLTAAFTPMIAVAALPVTAVVAVVASIVANVTARWIGLAVLVVAVVALGYGMAHWAAKYDDVPATRGVRRWLPLAATVVVVGSCLAEIVSGSHAPDPVLPLWFASIVWVFTFLPLAAGVWGPACRALWTVGPAVTFLAIVFVWTQGFFSLRFAHAVHDLDRVAARGRTWRPDPSRHSRRRLRGALRQHRPHRREPGVRPRLLDHRLASTRHPVPRPLRRPSKRRFHPPRRRLVATRRQATTVEPLARLSNHGAGRGTAAPEAAGAAVNDSSTYRARQGPA